MVGCGVSSSSGILPSPNTCWMFRLMAISRLRSSGGVDARCDDDERSIEVSQCFTRQYPITDDSRRNHPVK